MNSGSLELLLEVVLVPNPVDAASVPATEHALPLHHILPETALKRLSVRKLQQSVAVLEVLAEIAYIMMEVPS
jgi:hypothetical protein